MGHIVDLHCDTIMECMLKGQGLAGRPGHINLEKLANLAEAYLTTQLERGFSTLDFYKSLLI